MAPDGRIGVVAGAAGRAAAGDAVLAWDAPAVGHAPGCVCCVPRDGLAHVLSRWYIEQMRAGGALPARLLVATGAPERVAAVVAGDALLQSRFRYDGPA